MRLRRQQPVLITSAADPRHVDIRRRQSQYLFWMGFRVLCFVLAVVLFHGWIRFLAIVAALIIPWVAVVVANGGPAPSRGRPAGFRPASHSVGGGPATLESAEHPVVEGDGQDRENRHGPGGAGPGPAPAGPRSGPAPSTGPEPGSGPYPARGASPAGSTPSSPDQPTVDACYKPRHGAPAAPPPRPAERADVGFFGPRRPPRH
ncbi:MULTISPECIES: DUF3099 domain-containing protein [unclassified Pseudofrankia]|uniref:DUF3099 domain-containing protein n=1 Tax=unclassified Pseudofrankia TaxID=2994372 RepID=UPI0008DA494F|nr:MULTISPECIES: DUF3099 domain-containing protein [unclassified Pseudofrankia]MDT3442055.1 DUF3099 domain-containing protein [Pseudofrankia sp. BMG5.37]OHV47288.1 hypothetical protein BCD48_19830 [Pseudofrankia sp. BMG5.36]